MEVEVLVPTPLPVPVAAMDFNFDSSCSTPYISAPSSPQRFGNFFYSAPTSPTSTRVGFLSPSLSSMTSSTMMIPFNWEEKPGIPKTHIAKTKDFDGDGDDAEDFAFDFSGQLERPSVSADELFDQGKIKPLKPPPRLQLQQSINGGFGDSDAEFNDLGNFKSAVSSPRSPISQGKKMIKEAFSPRGRRRPSSDFDPFEEALKEARQETEPDKRQQEQQRGRERNSASSSNSKFVRKKTRSLSPFRVSDILFGHDQDKNLTTTTTTTEAKALPSPASPTNASSSAASFFASFSFSRAYRKLKLKDLLLFRSASEGRATSKATMNKYEVLSRKSEEQHQSRDLLSKYVMTSLPKRNFHEDVKNSSFRSTDSVSSSVGGGSVSSRRRGAPPLSAHELHYTVNRAVSEEMRRKTFLPYKQGLLGCLGFNPAVHDVSRGGGSMPRV